MNQEQLQKTAEYVTVISTAVLKHAIHETESDPIACLAAFSRVTATGLAAAPDDLRDDLVMLVLEAIAVQSGYLLKRCEVVRAPATTRANAADQPGEA